MLKTSIKIGIFALPAIAVALLGGCPSIKKVPKWAEKLSIQIDFKTHQLKNGLKVILVEDHNIPIISYQTWVRAGSVDDPSGQTGTAHFFEHLMFKGTIKYGPGQFFEQLESRGAQVNAYTTHDYTVYYQNFVPSLLDRVIDMESDRLANFKVTPELLEVERAVVFEERRLRTDNSPAAVMNEILWQLAYSVHPYRWPTIGTPQDLTQISADSLQEFFKKYYQPNNVALVVVGDFDSKSLYQKIEKSYAAIPSRPVPMRKFPVEPPANSERRYRLFDRVATAQLQQGYPVSKAAEADSYALDVMCNILFNGTRSRAWKQLVEEKEIALGVNGLAFTPTFPGLMTVSVMLRSGVDPKLAESALDQLFKQIQDNLVTEDDIEVAVRQLLVEFIENIRTPFGLGQLLGTVQMILGDARRYDRDYEKYLSIKPLDIQRVARKYLQPNLRSTVVLLPEAQKNKGGDF